MSGAYVFIDRSQFPENVRRDLLESLCARAINHKFHYESYKQAAKWLGLHEAYSPAPQDESYARAYEKAFAAVGEHAHSAEIHVVGFGCGGGEKEARLLRVLNAREHRLTYTACDVSLPLVLMAREAALPFVPEAQCNAVVSDLGTSDGLADAIGGGRVRCARVCTLFGIIPNFEPYHLFGQIIPILRTNELLLFSANLAPGNDYTAGVLHVLPQYDNELTRDWLMTLFLDLGFERGDGEIAFAIETDPRGLQRIAADFELANPRAIRVSGETISFRAAERIRIFFSYRHTPETLKSLVDEFGIEIIGEWFDDSKEEGVFLCRKRGDL